MNNIQGLISLNLFALLIVITITIIFYSKQRIHNVENNIYSTFLISNILATISGIILGILLSKHIETIDIFIVISNKIYMVLVLIWGSILTFYTIYVSYLKNKTQEQYAKHLKKFSTYIGIIILLVLLLPSTVSITENGAVAGGLSTNFVYIVMLVLGIIDIIYIFNDKENRLSKKYMPIYTLILLGSIAVGIQMIFPTLNYLINPCTCFITFLMYHTIENPDVKMLEEVSIAKEQAEKANNAKSDFLSNMSHEIRTPLNAIVGFSESLKEDNLSEDSKNKVDDIITASNNLLEIVNGILDISKIEANKLEIINKEYDIHSMLDELVSLTKARIGTKELNFKVSIDQALPSVLYGDNTRLKQIILNLLTNAVKYTKEGSIFFTVSTVVKDNICRLIISVEDTGIGMKEESLQKLFTKFERLNVEKQITIEGTGLGLAITKKLVDLMNGKIIVQSVYGKGSKFTVSIDQRIISVERPLAKQPAKSESKVIDANGAKILLVDDNELNIKVASTLLKKYNFAIESCTSAFACIAKIKDKNEYDIILMDDMMPKMTGKEAVKILKNEMNYKKPIIVLTANAITGMREEYLAAGFDDYLSKPIEKKELERVIKEHIHKTNSNSINTPSSLSTNSIISNKIDLEMPVLSKPQTVETQPINNEYSGKKVLLVDDNELNIKVALTVLKKYNLDITTVMSGSECIEKTIDNKYDLILLDDMMPELDGCTTLDNLKTLDNFNTPVVMMTASSKDEVQNKIIEHGFDGYLSKPFKKEDLDEILKTLLN